MATRAATSSPRAGGLAGIPPHDIINSSPRLSKVLAEFLALGASPFGALYDRQSLGGIGDRSTLGPPGRAEFNHVADPELHVINLATYGYVALGNDPRVKRAAISAIERYGTHTGGTRALSGTTRLHWEFEKRLASFVCAPRVVTYSSGYATNASVISALFGPGDVVILDRNVHRSLYDGALLARATIRRFTHNDLDHLDQILGRTSSVRRRLVVVETAYSMEGHLAPLPELVELVRQHGAYLLADEAHAIGVVGSTGRGATEHFGLDPAAIDIRIGTLSKAFSAVGGFAAVDASIAGVLRYASHASVHSAAMTPPDVGAAMGALEVLEQEPQRVARLQRNAALFRTGLARYGLDTMGSETAIVPVRIGDRTRTLVAAAALLERGVYVNAVIPPGVPPGAERLRCLVTAGHTEADLQYAAAAIGEVLDAGRAAT
jgi:8-amino-7-oxononanoate synthase